MNICDVIQCTHRTQCTYKQKEFNQPFFYPFLTRELSYSFPCQFELFDSFQGQRCLGTETLDKIDTPFISQKVALESLEKLSIDGKPNSAHESL